MGLGARGGMGVGVGGARGRGLSCGWISGRAGMVRVGWGGDVGDW